MHAASMNATSPVPPSTNLLTGATKKKVSVSLDGRTYTLERIGNTPLGKLEMKIRTFIGHQKNDVVAVNIDGKKFNVKKSDVDNLFVNAELGKKVLELNKNNLNQIFTTDPKVQRLVRDKIMARNSLTTKEVAAEGDTLVVMNLKGRVKVYKERDSLGEGAFKKVSSFVRLDKNKEVAFADVTCRDETEAEYTEIEYQIGKELYDSFRNQNPGQPIPFVRQHAIISGHKSNYGCGIMMERCQFDAGLEGGRLNPTQRADVMLDAMRGIAFMHKLGYTHSDIKPANILITNQNGRFQGKVADFGITIKDERLCNGSPGFLPPEFYGTGVKRDQNIKADSFAMGMTLLMLHTNKEPACFNVITAKMASRPPEAITPEDFDSLYDELNELDGSPVSEVIPMLLDRNPTKRITVEQALNRLEFLKGIYSKLEVGNNSS